MCMSCLWFYRPHDCKQDSLPPDTLTHSEVFLSTIADDNSLFAIVSTCQVLCPLRYQTAIQEREEGDTLKLHDERGDQEREMVFLCRRQYDEESEVISPLLETDLEIQKALVGIVSLDKIISRHVRAFQKQWIAACIRHGFALGDDTLADATAAFMAKRPNTCGAPVEQALSSKLVAMASSCKTSVYADFEVTLEESDCLIGSCADISKRNEVAKDECGYGQARGTWSSLPRPPPPPPPSHLPLSLMGSAYQDRLSVIAKSSANKVSRGVSAVGNAGAEGRVCENEYQGCHDT